MATLKYFSPVCILMCQTRYFLSWDNCHIICTNKFSYHCVSEYVYQDLIM